MINNATIDAKMYGAADFDISFSDTCPTLQPTYRQTPTGGVEFPIARFITHNTPSATGLYPNWVAAA